MEQERKKERKKIFNRNSPNGSLFSFYFVANKIIAAVLRKILFFVVCILHILFLKRPRTSKEKIQKINYVYAADPRRIHAEEANDGRAAIGSAGAARVNGGGRETPVKRKK